MFWHVGNNSQFKNHRRHVCSQAFAFRRFKIEEVWGTGLRRGSGKKSPDAEAIRTANSPMFWHVGSKIIIDVTGAAKHLHLGRSKLRKFGERTFVGVWEEVPHTLKLFG